MRNSLKHLYKRKSTEIVFENIALIVVMKFLSSPRTNLPPFQIQNRAGLN